MASASEKKDLYEILGISRDASVDDIKKAHRKHIKKCHPDVGGDSAEFRDVQTAYMVLSDVDRRKKYDQTGSVDEAAARDRSEEMVFGLIGSVLTRMLSGDANPIEFDLVEQMVSHFNEEKKSLLAERDRCKKLLIRTEKLRGRFKRKKSGANKLDGMVTWFIVNLKSAIEKCEEGIEMRHRAIEMLEDYSFDMETVVTVLKVRDKKSGPTVTVKMGKSFRFE